LVLFKSLVWARAHFQQSLNTLSTFVSYVKKRYGDVGIMGIFDFLKKKEKDPRDNFGEGDREFGRQMITAKRQLASRKAELDMQKAELEAERDRLRIQFDIENMQQKLEELQGIEEEEISEGSSIEDSLLTTLLTKVMTGQKANNSISPSLSSSPVMTSLTDEDIKRIWHSLNPKTQKLIKSLPDETIEKELLTYYPNLSRDTIVRATTLVRSM
jgi:hypothetical protein